MRAVVELRRPLTPAQARVLALLAEAPGYKQIAHALGVSKRTVRQHVEDIAAQLPDDWAPNAGTKDRVVLYAMRRLAESVAPRDRELPVSQDHAA